MINRLNVYIVLILNVCFALVCPAAQTPGPTDPNRYLNAVRTFADNVLKYGRDTYGPKHTPLFVDGQRERVFILVIPSISSQNGRSGFEVKSAPKKVEDVLERPFAEEVVFHNTGPDSSQGFFVAPLLISPSEIADT